MNTSDVASAFSALFAAIKCKQIALVTRHAGTAPAIDPAHTRVRAPELAMVAAQITLFIALLERGAGLSSSGVADIRGAAALPVNRMMTARVTGPKP